MTSFIDGIKAKAKAGAKTIVLPEGSDNRTLEAAQKIIDEQLASLIILGDEGAIKGSGYRLDGAEIIDPKASPLLDEFANLLAELRKSKGMTVEQARALVEDELYFGVLLVKTGRADGMVAGASHSTGDVLRPSLQILRTAPGAALVSSFFVMDVPDCDYGDNGTFIFADCGLNVQTDAESLANIAISSAKSWSSLVGTEPRVALLSHSSHGSAHNDDADKVVKATELAKSMAPVLRIDGELQLDAAIVPEVAQAKCPDSTVAGSANVLIFPDLDAGNIGYKLVQRLAKAEAYGPITQGLAAPVNDLSRGCCAEDIVGVVALTCVQAIDSERE